MKAIKRIATWLTLGAITNLNSPQYKKQESVDVMIGIFLESITEIEAFKMSFRCRFHPDDRSSTSTPKFQGQPHGKYC